MKFKKSMLKKLKKEELIDLILQLQEENKKSLYELAGKRRRICFSVVNEPQNYNSSKTRYCIAIEPGDCVKITSEEITPSGYPSSDTYRVLANYKLEKVLSDEDYGKLVENGWNQFAFNILKSYKEFNKFLKLRDSH